MNKIIRIGHIDLSFHASSAALVTAIFEKHGWLVENSTAPHQEMFERYGEQQVDMLVSAWLPASHGAYLAPYIENTVKLSVLYHPYCIWGVPDYITESEVASVRDLLKPDVLVKMEKCIQGINPGAGISRFSRRMIDEYQLGAAGYYFANGSEEECFSAFEQAVSEQRWIVIPLWHPQFLHHRYNIRALHEPVGLLGGHDEATLIASKSIVEKFSPELLDELCQLTPGNKAISELDYLICRKNKTPQQAVDIFNNHCMK